MAVRKARLGRATIAVADDQPTFWDHVEAGGWEPATLALYEREVGPGSLVLDLGAWIGPLALYAAALGARVVAVEADPAALDQLGRNLAVNPDLAARITVIPRAVASGAGPVRLGARRKPGDSMSSVLLTDTPRDTPADTRASWTAEAVMPGELVALAQPGERLFAKLDIEGGEYALLPALAPVLDRPGVRLLISLHPAILAEAGVPDPTARALAALRPFERWRAEPVGRHGSHPCPLSAASLAVCDTWILRRPDEG